MRAFLAVLTAVWWYTSLIQCPHSNRLCASLTVADDHAGVMTVFKESKGLLPVKQADLRFLLAVYPLYVLYQKGK